MGPAVLGFYPVMDLGCSESLHALVAFQLEQQHLLGAAETDNGTSSQLMPRMPSAPAAEMQGAHEGCPLGARYRSRHCATSWPRLLARILPTALVRTLPKDAGFDASPDTTRIGT